MAKKAIPTELKSLSAGERKEINDFIKSQGLTGIARTQAQITLARQAIIEREKRIKNLARAFKKMQAQGKAKPRRRRKVTAKMVSEGQKYLQSVPQGRGQYATKKVVRDILEGMPETIAENA